MAVGKEEPVVWLRYFRHNLARAPDLFPAICQRFCHGPLRTSSGIDNILHFPEYFPYMIHSNLRTYPLPCNSEVKTPTVLHIGDNPHHLPSAWEPILKHPLCPLYHLRDT